MAAGNMTVNMKDMCAKFEATVDTVVRFEHIMLNHGKFFTLDARPYMDVLDEMGIRYTFEAGMDQGE